MTKEQEKECFGCHTLPKDNPFHECGKKEKTTCSKCQFENGKHSQSCEYFVEPKNPKEEKCEWAEMLGVKGKRCININCKKCSPSPQEGWDWQGEFEKLFPNDNEFCCCGREYCYPQSWYEYEPLIKVNSFLSQAIAKAKEEERQEIINTVLRFSAKIKKEVLSEILKEIK